MKKRKLFCVYDRRRPDGAALVRELVDLRLAQRGAAGVPAAGHEQFCLRDKTTAGLTSVDLCHGYHPPLFHENRFTRLSQKMSPKYIIAFSIWIGFF